MVDGRVSGVQAGRRHDVGGVLLDRPFRIRRLGHFGYNVDDIAACLAFYCEWLGLRISDPQDLAANLPSIERIEEALSKPAATRKVVEDLALTTKTLGAVLSGSTGTKIAPTLAARSSGSAKKGRS